MRISPVCAVLYVGDAMPRSDRQYSSTGVISEEDRDGGQNQRRKQKDQYTHVLPVPGTSYLA